MGSAFRQREYFQGKDNNWDHKASRILVPDARFDPARAALSDAEKPIPTPA